MKKHPINVRIWGCAAHIPIITIIWASYVLYRNFSQGGGFTSLFQLHVGNSLPITPIILTLCSIPISLSIMYTKRKSWFVHDNAQEAYHFNIWLLKIYSVLFIGLLIGNYLSIKMLILACSTTAILVALLCFQQSIHGIITALFYGNVFRYWYPLRKRI